MRKIATQEEVSAVKDWAKHDDLIKLRDILKKSRIGTYMTIARVFRKEFSTRDHVPVD